MIAVIFEAEPAQGRHDTYLDIAEDLRPLLDGVEGFISVERFQSLTNPGKLVSLSFFTDEEAVKHWREMSEHQTAQSAGRRGVFSNYRLRVARVIRDYSLTDRNEVPK